MLCMISPAKTFAKKVTIEEGSKCLYPEQTILIMEQALSMSEESLRGELKLSPKMASEARCLWRHFCDKVSPEARGLSYYSGMVFKKINSKDFDTEDWIFADDHLRICSFVYGLLRPTTLIRPYRMEGTLRLEDGSRVFDFWRSLLTEQMLRELGEGDGILVNLASEEMQQLFHWHIIEERAKVVHIHFLTRQADGSLKTIVIYCKMARGAMMREIIKGRITQVEDLKSLSPEGFVYAPEMSDERNLYYILG